jgi:Mg2+-importing ATPase
LGSVAGLVSATVRQSSVSRSIGKFSQFIVQFILLTVSIIYVINVIVNNRSFFDADLLIFSVALAVTIIPEMLPTVTTFSLAQGALRLAEHKVIVKRLTAIEDLGSIQILCTDKTGTLTENKLVVAEVWADKPDQALFYAAMMATPASLESKKHAAFGFDQALWEYIKPEVKETLKTYDHVDEVPFEPERRRSSALVKLNDKYLLVVRGAYEEILKVSHNISEDQHQKIMQWIAQRGQEGKRVIAVAYREIPKDETSDLKKAEKNLTFQGIISFVDPIKKTTYEAIKEAQVLGVAIKILTGDSPEVAGAVAQKIGLITSPDKVMNGDKFAQLDAGQKQSAANEYAVFARISPQQKYEIIDVLRKRYEVGYLGDGINDAPALKLANVAICVEGSADVAQEAADIVLLKKSLFVIVDGIKEGRKIFANTIKYIKTTIFSNFGHFYSLAIASIILDYVPMLPLQMLLLNIITDFPMIAIATDNVDPDQLKEPHSYNVRDIALFSLTLSPISTIFDFVIFALFHKQEPAVLQTNWFIGTVITELFIILLLRTNRPFFKASRPSWYLLGIIFGGCCVTLALPYTHFGQEAFHFIPPTFHQLRLVFFAAIGYFAATECAKLMYYHMMHPQKNH